jgi:hypothetical protein
MIGIEVAVSLLVAWAIRKASRAGRRADQIVDDAIDTSLDHVHEVIIGKLGGDSSLTKLEAEAADAGEVSERTRSRVQLALEDATEEDSEFAKRLDAAVKSAQQATGPSTHAESGGVVNQIVGTVSGNVVQARDIEGGVTF